MNRSFLTGVFALGVLATTATVSMQPAQALQIITYDFSGPNNNPLTQTFTVSGFSVTATASALNESSKAVIARNVAIRSTGIGVQRDPGNAQISRGDGFIETLRLNFNGQVVKLISATFGNADSYDDFRLLRGDGTEVIQAQMRVQQNNNNPTFNFAQANVHDSDRTGTIFDFTVPALGTDDDYFLRSLTVEVIPTPAAVLPGLLGMGAAVLRKKQGQEAEG